MRKVGCLTTHRWLMGKQLGLSLIELMVSLAVLAVILTVATPSFLQWRRHTQLLAQTNHVVNALGAARSEALKRNTAIDVEFLKTDGAITAWRIYQDKDFSGSFTEAVDDLLLQSDPLPSVISVASNKGKIRYDGSGFARGANAATIKLFYKGDDGALQAARHIVLSNTGRVRSCTPRKLDGKTAC